MEKITKIFEMAAMASLAGCAIVMMVGATAIVATVLYKIIRGD